MIISIPKRKGLTGEQLIGIVCGSVAVFFIILYAIISIANRKRIHDNENWYKVVFSSDPELSNEYQQIEPENNDEELESTNEEIDINFWL